MKNVVKGFLLCLCLVLSLSLLMACGGGNGEQESQTDTQTVETVGETAAETVADTDTEAATEADTAPFFVEETWADMLAKALNNKGKQAVYASDEKYHTVMDDVPMDQVAVLKNDGSNYFVSYVVDGEELIGYTILQDKAYMNIFTQKEYFFMTEDQHAELLLDMGLVEDENAEIDRYVYTADSFTGLTGVVNADGSVSITVTGVSEDVMTELSDADYDAENFVQTLDSYVAVIDAEGRLAALNYQVTFSYDYEADGATVSTTGVSKVEGMYTYADVVIEAPENTGEYMLTTFNVYMGYEPDGIIAAAQGMPLDADAYTLDASAEDYDVETQYGYLQAYPACYQDKTFTLVGTICTEDGTYFTLQLLSEGMDTILPLEFPEGAPLPNNGDKVTITATFAQVDETCEGANFLCFAMQVKDMTTSSDAPAGDGEDTPQGTFMYVNVNSTLNVRTGPGTEYEVIGSFTRGVRIDVLEIANGWAKIVYAEGADGIGYVSASYIIETQPV